MPLLNCWLYVKLQEHLQRPLDLSPGPWPRGYVLSPAGTLNRLCVTMCVLCVLMANLRRGSVIQSSAIQPPASTTQAASPSPRATHLSLADSRLGLFPSPSKPKLSLFPLHYIFLSVPNSFSQSHCQREYIFLPVFFPPSVFRLTK